jgi:hypothetical protein
VVTVILRWGPMARRRYSAPAIGGRAMDAALLVVPGSDGAGDSAEALGPDWAGSGASEEALAGVGLFPHGEDGKVSLWMNTI